jgi:ABC-type nickel/cobalt efflux system permease component RcnA
VPSQQPQGQLQTQHSVDTGNNIVDKHDIKPKSNYRQALQEKHINAEKQTNKQNNNSNIIIIILLTQVEVVDN